MAKNTKLSVTNIHGTFTAPSEAAIEYMLATASQHAGLAKRLFDVYDADGASAYPISHFRRYSQRTLAIMLCDVYIDDVVDALARINIEAAKTDGTPVLEVLCPTTGEVTGRHSLTEVK